MTDIKTMRQKKGDALMGIARLYACIVELDEELRRLKTEPDIKDILYVKWLASEIRKEFEFIFSGNTDESRNQIKKLREVEGVTQVALAREAINGKEGSEYANKNRGVDFQS